jgi:hypothetical protein
MQNVLGRLNRRRVLLGVLALLSIGAGIRYREPVRESAELLLGKIVGKEPLTVSYEILSVSLLKRNELLEYGKREVGPAALDFRLDDEVIQQYHVFKVRLQNEGAALRDALKFEASIADGLAKIIDVKASAKGPTNKPVIMESSLPSLTWTRGHDSSDVVFQWDASSDGQILGYFIYKSVLNNRGYGRVNLGTIGKRCVVLTRSQLAPGYYAVAAMGQAGMLSELSAPIKFPEILALQPQFQGLTLIDPDFTAETHCAKREVPVYRSVTDAVRAGRTGIFVIQRRRGEARDRDKPADTANRDVRIVHQEELDFLRGRVDVSLPRGLERRADLVLLFVAKTLPGSEPRFALTLSGQRAIRLIERGMKATGPRASADSEGNVRKRSLTPRTITPISDGKGLALTWAPADEHTYTGIRVFRTILSPANSAASLGEEIYEGPVASATIRCHGIGGSKTVKSFEPQALTIGAPLEQPERKEKAGIQGRLAATTVGKRPAAPRSSRVTEPGVPTDYYRDTTPRTDVAYKYTIYTFDENGEYSYPVEVNASRADSGAGVACSLEEGREGAP